MKALYYEKPDETLYFADNGALPLYFIRRPHSGRFRALLTVRFGSADISPLYPPGTAHFLEHQMFSMPRDILAEFACLGASVNAYTDYEYTAYECSCSEQPLECLRLLLEMVATPHFTAAGVETERGIIDSELDMLDDMPLNKAITQLFAGLYERHPARFPIGGTHESVAKIDEDVLYSSYSGFYVAGNLALGAAGNAEPEAVAEIAAAFQGASGITPARAYGTAEPYSGMVRRVSTRGLPKPVFALGLRLGALPRGTAGRVAELELDAALGALCGPCSTLYERLYSQGLIGADFSYGLARLPQESCAVISGESRDPDAVCAALLSELEAAPDCDLFGLSLRGELGARVRALDDPDTLCAGLCLAHFDGAEALGFHDYPAKTNAEKAFSRLRAASAQCLSIVR